MAVAYESVGLSGWEGNASSETLVITKPTGLAVGDLMVAHLTAISKAATTAIWTTLSGWTLLGSGEGTNAVNQSCRLDVYYKIAVQADVDATNFTWTSGTGDKWCNGQIYRISGHGGAGGISMAADGNTGGTETYTNTLTPPANSLLLFLVSAGDNAASGSIATYAITTSNPTWTERYDEYGDATAFLGAGYGDGVTAGATASRPEATATGDSSCDITNFAAESVGVIVAIGPSVSVTVSPAVMVANASVQTGTGFAVTGTAVATPAVMVANASVQAPTVTTAAPKWRNTDKSAAGSVVNPDKS